MIFISPNSVSTLSFSGVVEIIQNFSVNTPFSYLKKTKKKMIVGKLISPTVVWGLTMPLFIFLLGSAS